jgi:hypothetical protein
MNCDAKMRRILASIALWVTTAGCANISVPCVVGDAECTAAARFAETHIDNNAWDGVTAGTISCDGYVPMSGGFEAERCWRIQLAQKGDPAHRTETVIVLTTEAEYIRFGSATTVSR